jgi:hypothetical protein
MRAFLLVSGLALVLFSCSNGRGSCRFNTDCASGQVCAGGRCRSVTDSGATPTDTGTTPTDSGPTLTDAGHDAATITDDAGHDAAVVTPDAGHDAAIVLADAGHDAGHSTGSGTLIFSEYVEGTSNNKALEIANVGTSAFDASACTVQLFSNGGATATATYPLTGTIAAGAVITICHASATGFSPASCTAMIGGGVVGFNGNDALVLDCGGTVDAIGQVGTDPGAAGWGSGSITTTDHTLRRACSASGDTNASDAFDPATEWTSPGLDVFDGLGTRGCP